MVWEEASRRLFLQSCHFQTAERILLMLEQELLDWRPPFHFPPFCPYFSVERKDFWFSEHQVERGKLVGRHWAR